MPRKQRAGKASRKLTMDSIDIPDILSFLAGWRPPVSDFERSRSRWQTWAEFDAEYQLLRDEFLQHEWALNSTAKGEVPFAELRYQAAQ